MENHEGAKYTYFAFISYNSKDTKWGKRLQRKLEHYRMPATLCAERKWKSRTPIRPVFFAPTDIQPGGLSDELKRRLESSQHLIVICSPNSAKSQWVGKEIEYFYQLGRPQNIHFFIVDGNPDIDDTENGCFNPILKQLDLPEILGANVHEKVYSLASMNRERAYIQLITKLLGIEFDTLWKRHKRLLVRQSLLGVAVILLVAVAIVLAVIMNKPVNIQVGLNETTPSNEDLPQMQNAKVTFTLENETKTITIANLKETGILANIPAKWMGRTAKVHFECERYLCYDTMMVLDEQLVLNVARDADMYGYVRFTLYDNQTVPIPNTKVFLDDMEGITDANGWVEFHVPIEKQRALYKVSSTLPLEDTLKDAPCGNTDAIFAK